MIVNLATVKGIYVNLRTLFQKAFKETDSDWEKLAMKVTSTTSEEHYWWLDRFPKLRKWIGEKAVKALGAFKYTLVNEDFEATVAIKRNHIKDNQLAGYSVSAKSIGRSAKEWPGDLVFALLHGGFTNLCYDGQPYFDTDHPVGSLFVSNTGKKQLSAATLAKAQGSYGLARTAMRKFKDEEGAPLKIKPNVLVVPPALEDEARVLLESEKFADGTKNIYKGTAELMVVDELESDTEWFLFDTNQIIKPFIFQEREAPEFVSQTNMDSDDVFMKAEYKFGVEARGQSGYGFWQMGYGSTGTEA